MNKFLRKVLILSISGLLTMNFSNAQITVADTLNANELAQYFIGLNLTISNVTLNCASGAFGTFEGSGSNIGIDTGILLTSGSINNVAGPNTQTGATMNNGAPGDPDLDALIPFASTNDACVLEFDLIPNSTVLYFRFVFGSEEYPEFVNSSFNDVFGFFISGPGIAGTENIARIPGTTTPVAINNVNNGNSCTVPGPCVNCAYYVNNCTGTTIEYDGFTTVITASIGSLVPTGTYHLKLAIADAGDFIFDSGVFLEAATNDTAVISCKPPQNLQTTFLNSTKVKLSWDAQAGATNYLLRGNKVGQQGYVFEQSATGQTSIIVDKLAYNTSYFWQVQSICESNLNFPSSPFTPSFAFTTGGACETPITLTVSNIQNNSAVLNWSAISGATSYVVKGRAVGTSTIVTLDGITNNFLAVGNLQAGTSYEWVVKAICAGPNSSSEHSQINTFTTTSSFAKNQDRIARDLLEKSISIFPNPTTGEIQIELTGDEADTQIAVQIFSHDGRLVFDDFSINQGQRQTVHLPENLQNGIYSVQVQTGGGIYNERLMLIR